MDELYPDFFARFYDVIYHQVRDSVDNSFYLDRIKECNGRILEVGSGTGRLFTQALDGGADIHGIDVRSSMIDVLKAKLQHEEQHRVSLQNIVDFSSASGYDLIIAPFRVFMHLADKTDQLNALNNVFRHLNPGGKFIFDVFNPDLKSLISGLENITDFEGEYEPGKTLRRKVSTSPDLINQVINITFKIEWNDGESDHSGEWHTRLRYFFRFELEHLLERSEFSNCRISGDFEGRDLSNNSKEFIITCIK